MFGGEAAAEFCRNVVDCKMEIVGTFYEVNNYFKLLYETDRIITVENLDLQFLASNNEEINVKARFVASTFRLPDGQKNEPLTIPPNTVHSPAIARAAARARADGAGLWGACLG